MQKNRDITLAIIAFVVIVSFINLIIQSVGSLLSNISTIKIDREDKKSFKIISSTSNKFMDEELKNFAKKNKIKISIDYFGDLEIVDKLNSEENIYDGVWISNSIWLYMLDNTSLVTESKSIAIDPVVMAVKKSLAESLGLTSKDTTNIDILNHIKAGNLNYVMPNVTKTNTGATAYLGFLNSLAGSPEVLTLEMLDNPILKSDMKTFFTGVERVSGDEEYLETMFMSGTYDAIINYESSLIDINKNLEKNGKEPLYLIYPKDGVAINDMPFGYVNRNQDKKENFEAILQFLRSEETAKTLEAKGYRTWYGGTKSNTDNTTFKTEWGIDTDEYLMPLKYPSKKVITASLDMYIEELRKPTHTVFCLDVSGSMSTGGLDELKNALHYIMTKETASKDRLQFSSYDKISIITFNSMVQKTSRIFTGDDETAMLSFIDNLYASGGTDIYSPSIAALRLLNDTTDEYTKTVILMTDGESNTHTFDNLKNFYNRNQNKVPIYSIMFGNSSEYQLEAIANLTNAKVFDGKEGLKKAFMEVRSYN